MTNFLDVAADLAGRVDPHQVAPNPRVGCVIVQNGKVIARGVHEKFGGEHAEVNALKTLNISNFSECEWYVTLEPCDSFHGKKTPSCTELLIQKKPKKIVVGSLDPQFGGKNIKKLQNAGLEVVLEDHEKCRNLNPFFDTFVTQKRPYITLKFAQSFDGKIAKSSNSNNSEFKFEYISNELSRQRVHTMRAQYSALLTTTKTILTDDPLLNCRTIEKATNPQIIVLGKKSDIPPHARIFSIPERKIHFFDIHNLRSVLSQCAKLGIDSIITECGSTVMTALLSHHFVDEIQCFIAPQIFGSGKPTFTNHIDMSQFSLNETQCLGGDIWIRFFKNKFQ
jgi:diaminohydroxyphosphoribosylaminopyrimidine deaminase/5-amino-6-(5-phosphoribosylamino)uracil reductase